jgi:hypothetical protein
VSTPIHIVLLRAQADIDEGATPLRAAAKALRAAPFDPAERAKVLRYVASHFSLDFDDLADEIQYGKANA